MSVASATIKIIGEYKGIDKFAVIRIALDTSGTTYKSLKYIESKNRGISPLKGSIVKIKSSKTFASTLGEPGSNISFDAKFKRYNFEKDGETIRGWNLTAI